MVNGIGPIDANDYQTSFPQFEKKSNETDNTIQQAWENVQKNFDDRVKEIQDNNSKP